MKILVCVKQVPDMESRFRINPAGTWYEETDLAWRLNEYDEYAVEQAVQVKEKHGADITVLSIGPDRVKEILRKAFAIGCDRGVHIKDDASNLRDSKEIASMIRHFAQDKGFDLIFTGMQSQDRGSAQVGILLSEMLDIPSVSTVVDFNLSDGEITAKRELEGGLKSLVRLGTPALITCQLGLNTPRYPTLPNIMKAKRKELLDVSAEVLQSGDRHTATEKMYFPEKKGCGIFVEGDVNSSADQLIQIMRDKNFIAA